MNLKTSGSDSFSDDSCSDFEVRKDSENGVHVSNFSTKENSVHKRSKHEKVKIRKRKSKTKRQQKLAERVQEEEEEELDFTYIWYSLCSRYFTTVSNEQIAFLEEVR